MKSIKSEDDDDASPIPDKLTGQSGTDCMVQSHAAENR